MSLQVASSAFGRPNVADDIDWSDLVHDNTDGSHSSFLRNDGGTRIDGGPVGVPDSAAQGAGTAERLIRGMYGVYADVDAILDGGMPDPPAPRLLHRTDGNALFYDGQVNLVFGDPESGKSWIAAAACAEALRDGRRVFILDMDHNGVHATVSRLLSLGAPEAALRSTERFLYAEPDDKDELAKVIADVCDWRPAVAVVDSVGELLPLLGLSSNSPDDFTAAHSAVLKVLAKSGAAVVAIDHLAKGSDSRAHGPTGTAAKRRAIGGVSLRVTIKEAFTPGKGGSAYLAIHKDRHGGLRAHCPTGDRGEPLAGTFKMTQHDDGSVGWKVWAPEDGERAPVDGVKPGDLAALSALDPPPSNVADVKDRMHWGSDRATAALSEWRSSVPDTALAERGTAKCEACAIPLDQALVQNGETTHPGCPRPFTFASPTLPDEGSLSP